MENIDPTQLWMLGVIGFGVVFYITYKIYH